MDGGNCAFCNDDDSGDDIISKYERIEDQDMKKMRVSQFAKMYEASWKGPEENKVYSIDETNKFNFIMAGDESKIPLKKFIKIK